LSSKEILEKFVAREVVVAAPGSIAKCRQKEKEKKKKSEEQSPKKENNNYKKIKKIHSSPTSRPEK